MYNPLVSIIVPNYNHSVYLHERIESILNQTYTNIEIILLDDCSNDNSVEVLNSYRSHPKIAIIIINEKNSGSTFKQWELGISKAQGELIWIAESDDYCDKNFLEASIIEFTKNRNIGIVYCKSLIVDKNGIPTLFQGNESYPNESINPIFNSDFTLDGDSFIENYMTTQNAIPNASAVIFRRNLYSSDDISPSTMKLYGDWMIWIKMLMNTNIHYIGLAPMNYFRNHQNTVRNKHSESFQSYLDFFEIAKTIIKKYPETKVQLIDKLHYKYFTYFYKSGKLTFKEKWLINRQLTKLNILHPLYLIKRTFIKN